MRASVRLLLFLAIASSAACGPTVDLTKGLQVAVVDSGWYDLAATNVCWTYRSGTQIAVHDWTCYPNCDATQWC